MVSVLAVSLVVVIAIFSWYRNDLRLITRDYAYPLPFNGTLQPCQVRFPLDESSTECLLGANRDGLYLSSSPETIQKSKRWSRRINAIGTPVFIPWQSLHITAARFPLRRYLRFSVPSLKADFFIPKETGYLLLTTAGRAIPSYGSTSSS